MSGSGSANVQSIDAVRDVRLALISFHERTNSALDDLRTKLDRTLAWLEQDRPMYWRDQERRAYDRVAASRVAYETCRRKTVGGRHPECIEEKVALKRAKERLEFCQHKVEVVRRWCVEASRQVDEFRGRCSPLKTSLEQDVPNVVAMLARMIDSLEAYAEIHDRQASGPSVSLSTDDDDLQQSEIKGAASTAPVDTNHTSSSND